MAFIRNPFIVGGPVPPELFVGREKEVNAIMNRLTSSRPASSAIYGETKIGKTSLLHYLKSAKVWQEWDISSQDYSFVYLDCGVIANPVYVNFWKSLFMELKNEVQYHRVVNLLT